MSTPIDTPVAITTTHSHPLTTYATIERDGTTTRTAAPMPVTHATMTPTVPAASATTEPEGPHGWYPPHKGDGLQVVRGYSNKPGWGEPLNIIISAHSDPYVLTDEGFEDYCETLGFTYEFMHLHGGPPMTANLGDGGDWKDQLFELRENYGSRHVGTGIQTLVGGNHLRMWRQDGPQANTGALFLALSMTENLRQHHKTTEDGYNRGRDGFVELALAGGKKSRKGHHYETTVEHVEGLFCNNDYQFDHGVAQDDRVAVLIVKIKPAPASVPLTQRAKAALHSFIS